MNCNPTLEQFQAQLDLHETALERLSIECVGHDDYDDVVKRLDQLETSIQRLAQADGKPL